MWVAMPQTTFPDENISKFCEIIISGLSGVPVDIDDFIAWCDQPSAVVWAAILELELAGQSTPHYAIAYHANLNFDEFDWRISGH